MNDLRQTVVVVSQGSFDADPRHTYWSSTLKSLGCDVVEIEILDQGCPARLRASASARGDRWTVTVNRFAAVGPASRPPIETSTGRYLVSSDRVVFEGLGLLAPVLNGVSMIVAIDLLVARSVTSRFGDVPMVYDAHEVFVESYDMLDIDPLSIAERRYWKDAEREVARSAFATVTVSPGIADFMKEYIDTVPWVIPNYLPISLEQKRASTEPVPGPVRFVFVGRADPHRGLERLVSAWDFDESRATLDLYITESANKKRLQAMARAIHRTHSGPVFKASVDPLDIPVMLGEYHVGVIPYEYPHPYSEASPNKFGEYVAAGLGVISNGSGFVSRKVVERSLGAAFDWSVPNSFVSAVETVIGSVESGLLRRESELAFREEMNWEVAARPLLAEISSKLRSMPQMMPFQMPLSLRSVGSWSAAVSSVVLGPTFELIRRSPRVRSVARAILRVTRPD